MECSVKNPKDVWNEFRVIDTDNFDFSKTNILLNQKCKNCFLLEQRKGTTMKCFWGNGLFNRMVVYINPLFKRLFRPVMEEKQEKIE